MYVPTHESLAPLRIHVLGRNRTKEGQQALIHAVSQTVRSMNSPYMVNTVDTLKQRYQGDEFVWLSGVSARLALTFGAMALFLAALGIYATKMYMVASRIPEIGIRMALGATRKNIIVIVLREGLMLTLVGLTIGLGLGLALAKMGTKLLYNVNSMDPISIGITTALLAAASLLASYIPARRAAKIDPMEALRYE